MTCRGSAPWLTTGIKFKRALRFRVGRFSAPLAQRPADPEPGPLVSQRTEGLGSRSLSASPSYSLPPSSPRPRRAAIYHTRLISEVLEYYCSFLASLDPFTEYQDSWWCGGELWASGRGGALHRPRQQPHPPQATRELLIPGHGHRWGFGGLWCA